jgi:hypothetical protein
LSTFINKVKERLKDEISVEHFYYMKRQIKKNLGTKLSYLRKDRTAFIAEIFFRRVSELEKLQKEQWLTGLSFLHDYNGQNSFSEFLEADSRRESSLPSTSESRSFPEANEPVV